MGRDVWGFWFESPDKNGYYQKSDALWVEVDRPTPVEALAIRVKHGDERVIQAAAAQKAAEAATGQKVVHVMYDP